MLNGTRTKFDAYGAFVILTIDEGQSVFFADGTPRKIDFSISLLAVDGPAPRANG